MNKVISIALFGVLLSVSAIAQNNNGATDNEQLDLLRENRELRQQIDKLNKQLDDCKAQQDKSKTSVLKQEIEKWKGDYDALCAENIKLKEKVDSLNKVNRELRTSKNKDKDKATKDLEEQLRNAKAEIALLKEELSNLQSIKKIYLKEMVANLKEDFLDKPFSQIDNAKLQNVEKDFAQFANEDKSIENAYKQLSTMKKDYMLYLDGIKAVNSPYDAITINKIKTPLYNLYEKIPDSQSAKKSEIYSLYWQLNNYESKISVFKQLVTIVDQRIKSNPGLEWDYAKTEIDSQESEKKVVTSICAIPYLKQLYEDYFKKLEGRYNTKKISESDYKTVHDNIMNL